MLMLTDKQILDKYMALLLAKDILGGIKGIADALGIHKSTVKGWCAHPETNGISYRHAMKLSRLTGINITIFLPDQDNVEPNQELNKGRLNSPVPMLQVEAAFLSQRTLPYLNYQMNERVILDSNYWVITGSRTIKQRLAYHESQRKVSAIRLDLSMLMLGFRTLKDFSDYFSPDERLTMGTYLFEQWDRLQKESEMVFEREKKTLLKDKESHWGPDWDLLVGDREAMIAQIVGMDSKETLLDGMQLYKHGILELRTAHNQGVIPTDEAAKLSKLNADDQLRVLNLYIQKFRHPLH